MALKNKIIFSIKYCTWKLINETFFSVQMNFNKVHWIEMNFFQKKKRIIQKLIENKQR